MNDSSARPVLLIVDDEPSVRDLLADILCADHDCLKAESGEAALELLASRSPAVVISDINMPGMSGLELVPKVLETSPDTVVMIVSGNQNLDSAIEAIRAGAFDFIKKPFEIDHVEVAVRRALEHHRLLVEKRLHDHELEHLVEERTRRLEYLAYYDELTGLPNRRLFDDRVRQATLLGDGSHRLAVLLASPDRFRDIRQAVGHATGNELLRAFAGRLADTVPAEVTIARFEADEFGILLPEISAASDAVALAGRLLAAVRSPMHLSEHSFTISGSIGISLCPEDGSDPELLVRQARIALGRAAAEGQNSYEFFESRMHAAAMRRLDLENDLRHAILAGELEAHFQPKLDTLTGRISGCEALMRWWHPVLGWISPSEFILIAEDTGLIVDIGDWVLRESCLQAAAWNDDGHEISVAVNVSPRQFDTLLADKVYDALAITGLDPHRLNLEVTESSLMRDADTAVSVLGKLKKMGIQVSIDDFGTGYSSLGLLKKLPIDVLKIDQSFVRDVTVDSDAGTLVMAIVSLAHTLGLKVVAEGVENEAQLRYMKMLRCDEWQGFLFSKPVPAEEFARLLHEGRIASRTVA